MYKRQFRDIKFLSSKNLNIDKLKIDPIKIVKDTRSKIENYFSFIICLLMISTFAYVLYQIYGGNPLENIENMSQQATIQKLIVLVNILCVFIISYAFSSQYRIITQKETL